MATSYDNLTVKRRWQFPQLKTWTTGASNHRPTKTKVVSQMYNTWFAWQLTEYIRPDSLTQLSAASHSDVVDFICDEKSGNPVWFRLRPRDGAATDRQIQSRGFSGSAMMNVSITEIRAGLFFPPHCQLLIFCAVITALSDYDVVRPHKIWQTVNECSGRNTPDNTTCSSQASLMLGQRRRRWPNIKPAWVQRLVIAGRQQHQFHSWFPAFSTTKQTTQNIWGRSYDCAELIESLEDSMDSFNEHYLNDHFSITTQPYINVGSHYDCIWHDWYHYDGIR